MLIPSHSIGSPQPLLAYRADIDGLRALAVLAVLLFHAREAWLPGGYLGVDVFFVISGYLISGIALRECQLDTFRWRQFYERRARRLMPALLTVLTVTTATTCLLMQPQERAVYGRSLLSTLGWVSNFYFWRTSAYFGEAASGAILLHTWSLAVEEQFYLLFPLLLAFIAPRSGVQGGVRVTALLALGLVLSLWAATAHPTAAFYLLPFRAWELLAGATLAFTHVRLSPQGRPSSLTRWIGATALVCLMATMALGSYGTVPHNLSNFVVVTCSVALIHAGRHGQGLQHRVLTFRPLVMIGLISYSLYLWHQPALHLMRLAHGPDLSTGLTVLALLGALLMAVLSWRFVERPWRKVSAAGFRGFIYVWGPVGLLLACLGTWLHVNQGLGRPSLEWQRAVLAVDFDTRESQGVGSCFLRADQRPEEFGACRLAGAGEGTALLWGDSHGAHLVPGFKVHSTWFAELKQRNFSACPGLLPAADDAPACLAARQFVMREIRSAPPEHVLLAGRWASGDETRLALTVATLRQMGVPRVSVLGPVPRWRGGLPGWLVDSIPRDAAQQGAMVRLPTELPLPYADAQARLNARLQQSLQGSGANYVDMLPLLCPHWPKCLASEDATVAGVMAWDADHLTRRGSEFLAVRLSPLLGGPPAH